MQILKTTSLVLIFLLGLMGSASAVSVKITRLTDHHEEDFPLPRSWYVATDGSDVDGDGSHSSPYGTIQHAMSLTAPGDTVLVECGTYYESGIHLQTGVTLRSESGEASCVTIDAQQQHYAMGCYGKNSIRVEGLTIINGYESYAGAMWFGQATYISVKNCNLNNNYAGDWGGGIYCYNAEIEIRNVTFSDNFAGIHGSGIALNETSTAIIENTIFSGNGGAEALYCAESSTVDLSCCDIFGNIGGDWIGCIEDQLNHNGNISADPLFCGPSFGEYSLALNSPCAAENNLGCGQIGALGIGCANPSGVEDSGGLPTAIRLEGSYPNPFNPQTTIAFELPKREAVTLRVFDIAGRLVKSLISAEPHTPGRHEVVWNGRDESGRQVASGTYFYRLEAGSYSETKRMVLIK